MACPQRVIEHGTSTKHALGPETDAAILKAWERSKFSPNATASDFTPNPSEAFHELQAWQRLGPPLLVESATKQTASGLLVVLLDNKMLRSQGPIVRSSLLSRKESNGTTCTWSPTA